MMRLSTAEQAGYTATSDYNGYRQEGFGAADMTIIKGGGGQPPFSPR